MDGSTRDHCVAVRHGVGVVSYQIYLEAHRGVEACDQTYQVARHGGVVCHRNDLVVHHDAGVVYHKICQEVHRDMVVVHDDMVCHLAIALSVCHHKFFYRRAEEEVYYNNRHNRNCIGHSNLICNRQGVVGVDDGGDVGEEDNHKEGVDDDGDAEVVAVVDDDDLVVVAAVDHDGLVVVVVVPCLPQNSAHCHIGNTDC